MLRGKSAGTTVEFFCFPKVKITLIGIVSKM
jgi:hypothetical protein